MSEADRWRLWIGFIVVSAIVGLAGLAVAVASLSRTAVLVDLVLTGLVVAVMLGVLWHAHRRPGLLVPPSMQGLDPDSRRLVSRAVTAGAPADRPELARAVVRQARRKESVQGLLVALWVVLLAVRGLALSAGDSGERAAFDLLVILGSALALAASVPPLLRARRAVSANRRPEASRA